MRVLFLVWVWFRALNGDGFVKTPEFVDYVEERVPELSKSVFGVEQFPTVNIDGQTFPISQISK